MAAKWFLRHFHDGIVRQVPDPDVLAELESTLGGATIRMLAHEGTRLSDSYGEDSYSYVLAEVFVGGRDPQELQDKYEQFLDSAKIKIDDVEET